MKQIFLLYLMVCLSLVSNAQIMGSTTYDFTEGIILPSDGSDQTSVTSNDNALVINQGTGGVFKYHGSHGGVFNNGNTFTLSLADQATVTFTVCEYSADGATLAFTDAAGNVLGAIEAESNGGTDGETREFIYSGAAQLVTATLVASGSVYMHAVSVDNKETPPEAIIGTTVYDLTEGIILPSDGSDQTSIASSDKALAINQGAGGVFKYHGSHGGVFNNGNTFTLALADQATVTFTVCEYSADGATLAFTDAAGNVLGSIEAESNGGADGEMREFSYAGSAQLVTATLVASGAVYMHAITIENAAPIVGLGGMVEVWDFGAEQFDPNMYLNKLDTDVVNAWYDTTVVVGTSANKIPNFTTGVLTWFGKPASDRLRTSNEALTRYDENVGGGSEHAFTGRVYANGTVSVDDSGLPVNRYFAIEVAEDDEVIVSCISQNGSGTLTFINESDPTDVQQVSTTSEVQDYLFVASTTGVYRIFDASDKLSCYRIMHRNATYVNISGDIDATLASNINAGYGILFKNVLTGKSWSTTVAQAAYDIALPAGFSYDLSLSDANGYMISNITTIVVDADANIDLVVEQLELSTVSGSISGLGDFINNLELVYAPDSSDKVYKPEVIIDATAGTYTAVLETSCPYTISAVGVNDYSLSSTAINVTSDQVLDVVFTAKPVYDVALTAAGLDAEQLAALQITFSNLNEEGYSYQFNDIESIVLRDGVYSVVTSGIDSFALMQALTSNLVVEGANADKSLAFDAVTMWNFDEKGVDGNAYLGLLFSPDGLISSQVAKGHLVGKAGGKVRIPVSNGDKVMISYYYNADITINTDTQLITTSGSTSLIESYAFQFVGEEKDTLTLTIGDSVSTTYITRIKISSVLAYAATVTVGADKDYQTINAALEAVAQMDRSSDERVSIMIDPGNYEEMIVIDQANVSLVNAAAAPSIALANQGVDIDVAAVRITSYYGHGYSYYSMGNDQKWQEEVLAVNKENGYLSYVNKGSGTTNGSYWNATLVVAAEGFVAKGIIIENSFNQYISQKESEDVVLEWETGGKGTRSTSFGDVAVQDRTFVERGAAIAVTASGDKTQLVNCRIVGRQDSFYGSRDARLVMYGGAAMGAVDYIFGGMTAVFYKTDLVLNTSDASNDVAYITAAQQESGRGFLMYECHIKSPALNTETASTNSSKPGYFGRPWSPSTSEVVFFNTKIDKSAYPGSEGISLILPAGWMSSLGGESENMCEYGTVELSGEDHSGARASWSHVMTTPTLVSGVDVTPLNFTTGNDGWDPITDLIANEPILAISSVKTSLDVDIYAANGEIIVKALAASGTVEIYNLQGVSALKEQVLHAASFTMPQGFWIVKVTDDAGAQTVKTVVL